MGFYTPYNPASLIEAYKRKMKHFFNENELNVMNCNENKLTHLISNTLSPNSLLYVAWKR